MLCRDTLRRRARWSFVCASVVVLLPFVNAANRPIPEVVNITVFSRVDAHRLELLVRVPLAALKDIQFPTRGDGDTLDLPMLKSNLVEVGGHGVVGGGWQGPKQPICLRVRSRA